MSWWAFSKSRLDELIGALSRRGYRVLGPTPRDGAIAYAEIESGDQFPRGLRDRQEPGGYRLEAGSADRYFDVIAGPASWKSFVHPARKSLFVIHQEGARLEVPPPPGPAAFLGVRACELAALAVLGRAVPLENRPFVVAVECMRAGELCFCASMGTGPEVGPGYDLVLDELDRDFLVRSGSERGQEVLASLELRPATSEQVEQARRRVEEAAASMGRRMRLEGIRDLLVEQPEHPHWARVALRCLGCANCTMVCPTCFCTTVEDHTDLSGQRAERVELWDSCFDLDFTFTNGQPARRSVRSRYRQWLTHKLGSWYDQFGTSGCVGCGRCIAWCPVGIDLTEEVAAIQEGTA